MPEGAPVAVPGPQRSRRREPRLPDVTVGASVSDAMHRVEVPGLGPQQGGPPEQAGVGAHLARLLSGCRGVQLWQGEEGPHLEGLVRERPRGCGGAVAWEGLAARLLQAQLVAQRRQRTWEQGTQSSQERQISSPYDSRMTAWQGSTPMPAFHRLVMDFLPTPSPKLFCDITLCGLTSTCVLGARQLQPVPEGGDAGRRLRARERRVLRLWALQRRRRRGWHAAQNSLQPLRQQAGHAGAALATARPLPRSGPTGGLQRRCNNNRIHHH